MRPGPRSHRILQSGNGVRTPSEVVPDPNPDLLKKGPGGLRDRSGQAGPRRDRHRAGGHRTVQQRGSGRCRLHPHRCLGLDGGGQRCLGRTDPAACSLPGQCGLMRETRNPAAKFMHCLPADHDTNTVVAREIMEHTGMTSGLEVTGEVFRSPASILFDQAENRLRQHLAGAAGGAALAPTDGALGTGMMANPGSPCQIEGSSGGAHPLKGDAPGQGRC